MGGDEREILGLPVGLTAISNALSSYRFDHCPICADSSSSLTNEHVPPDSMGGDNLGTFVDPDLKNWLANSDPYARIELAGVQGRRKVGFELEFAEKNPNLVIDGDGDPELRDYFAAGRIGELTLTLHEQTRYRLAALKNVYLSICVYRQQIPATEFAESVRHDLILARNRELREDSDSPVASSLEGINTDIEIGSGAHIVQLVDAEGNTGAGVSFGDHVCYGDVVSKLLTDVSSRLNHQADWP